MKILDICKIALVFLFMLLSVSITSCNNQATEDRQVIIVFRFDDYSALSSTEMELKIIDAFRAYDASITFGVIPFIVAGDGYDPAPQDVIPLTSEKGEILRQGLEDGVLDIALHGYSHQSVDDEVSAELFGDYHIQLEKLTKGKRFLDSLTGIYVKTFVPPWNAYDVNTLQALEELGFSTISAWTNGAAIKNSQLLFLPATTYDFIQLKEGIDAASKSSDHQPVVVILLHEYDFVEIDEDRGSYTYQEFMDLLDWLNTRKDINLLSISQAQEVINDLSVDRFLSNQWSDKLYFRLPPIIQNSGTIIYPESRILTRTILKFIGFYLSIGIVAMIVSFITGNLVFRKSEFIMKIITIVSIMLTAIILIYVFHDLKLLFNELVISAITIGVCFGFLIYGRKVLF